MKLYVFMDGGKFVYLIMVDVIKFVVEFYKNDGKVFKMGMVFFVFIYNYEICYWLVVVGIYLGMYIVDNI